MTRACVDRVMNAHYTPLMRIGRLAVWLAVACGSPMLTGVPGGDADAGALVNDSGLVDAGTVDAGTLASFDSGLEVVVDAGVVDCQFEPSDAGFSRTYVFGQSGSLVQDKAFYLLTLLQSERLGDDTVLGPLAAQNEAKLRGAAAQCGADVSCYSTALVLSDDEITRVSNALSSALGPCRLARLAQGHLRPSGLFSLHAAKDDSALLIAAWQNTAVSLRSAFNDYGASLGGTRLKAVVSEAAASTGPMAFYEPLLRVVLASLKAQSRDEAARYEPMTRGVNAAALATLPAIAWSDYPYTAILVPGQGPNGSEPLNPIGQARCDLALERYQQKKAPFIVTSGGHVQPDRTAFAEAIEMKKYLISKGVPEAAILVDPHARHTTTNLRNASRLLIRAGFPLERPVMVTSDVAQSAQISYHSLDLDKKCLDQLGYLPFRDLRRVGANDSSYYPIVLSMQANGSDLLDP